MILQHRSLDLISPIDNLRQPWQNPPSSILRIDRDSPALHLREMARTLPLLTPAGFLLTYFR